MANFLPSLLGYAETTNRTSNFDSAIIKQIANMITLHFANGFRLNSPIEMSRFRSFAEKEFGERFVLTDAELRNYISICGVTHEDKVYVISRSTKERIEKEIDDYFASGAKAIFFSEFYSKNEDWLFRGSVVSEELFIETLRDLFSGLSFKLTYFGYTKDTVPAVIESEIVRVWDDDALLTYEQISERLKYVPIQRIKQTLITSDNFVYNSRNTFARVDMIEVTDEERKIILETAMQACNARGYVSIAELQLEEITERNYEFSDKAIQDAIYCICLSNRFGRQGKIVTRKGDRFDALTIMKEYCRTVDRCSLSDLLNLEKELTGEVHHLIPLNAANAALIRTSKETFVADKHVHFDIESIDRAVGLSVREDYLTLKAFTTFVTFPDSWQTWNLFLLESYCRRFSQKFRFVTSQINSKSVGVVVRKSCTLSYDEIMVDAVLKADIQLESNEVNKFLVDNGYMSRNTNVKAKEIVNLARTRRKWVD
jgi:hypothetical protein